MSNDNDWGTASDYHPSDCTCESCMASIRFNRFLKECFPYNTLIETPTGKRKIGDLQKGQMVLSYSNGKLVPRIITHKLTYGVSRIIQVNFDDGNTLLATGHHSFLTTNGWKKLSSLHIGDNMVRADADISIVKSIIPQQSEPVFNIYTANEHNFIADGFVAHNFTEFRTIRTILHQMFLDPVAKLEMALC